TYSTEWVIAWLAVARIGALAMPFSSIYKPAELATVMRIGDVHTLLVAPEMLGHDVPAMVEEAIPALADADGSRDLLLDELPYLRQVLVWGATDRGWARPIDVHATGDHPSVSDALFDAVEEQVVPADWAQVTYTSGSSALPKGVVHSHGAIVRTTGAPMWLLAGGAPNDDPPPPPSVSFCAFPFFWIGGTLVIGGAIQRGTTLCCLPKFEPGAALDMMERERCVSVSGWTSLVQALRGHPSFPERDLSHVPMFQPNMGGLVPVGPVPGIAGHRSMSELVGNWAGSERHAIDPDTGETLADLEEGELVVRGFGMMQGYYKREREDTFDPDGWLHTGDRVFLHENRVYFVGRFYEMVKSQGANVAPREVETVLEEFPEIQHAFVFGTPHPTMEEEVCAAIVLMPGQHMTVDEIRERAGKLLSSYKVPTRFEFLASEDDIPWLGSGKPDKLTLRDRLLASG
ncbi:MAG TPA: long-chain fatty acid--CoA ligase, partial [Acidimicrobiia bacterium]|nr:long-chain fatty acid--CoA ligase [Acidimicrobiia bacterium]